MMIRIDTSAGLRKIRIEGEMNIYSAPELKRRLLEQLGSADEVEINLSHVSEMDSAGFQVLCLAKREAATSGKTLNFTSHSPAVAEVIGLYSMAAYFGGTATVPRTQKKTRTQRRRVKTKRTT